MVDDATHIYSMRFIIIIMVDDVMHVYSMWYDFSEL